MVLGWCECTVNTQTHAKKNHASFTHSADTHTPAEHSFEPAAEIQVALDHFSCVFFLFPSARALPLSSFLGGLFTQHLSQLPPSVSFSLPLPFSLRLSLPLSFFVLTVCRVLNQQRCLKCKCAYMHTLIRLQPLYFHAKLPLLCILQGPVVTPHKHTPVPRSAYIIG